MMEIILILRVLLRRWWLVLIPVAIVAIIVVPDFLSAGTPGAGGFTTMVRFSAAQEFNLPERDGDYQDVWLASELAVNALTAWVQTNSFRQEMSLALAEGGTEFNLDHLGLAADNERSVGQLFLSWSDADELQVITAAALAVLQTRTQNYFPQLGDEPAQVTLLDSPVIVPAPPPIANRFAPLIKLALGLLAGIGLAFLAAYFDPAIYQRDEVEALGLPIVATIPRHKR
jgi:hypothetical protein